VAQPAPPAESPRSKRRREALCFVAILVLAAALRFYDLNRLPPGLWFDEGLNGLNALSILHDHPFRLYFDNREFFDGRTTNSQEPMFHYLLALAVALMGPSVLALRVVSAAVGVATVGIFYGLVRAVWDSRRAALAALLLAVLRWHVHFSRTVFRTVLVPLFACLFFWFWWVGFARRRKSHLVAAGLFLGLGFYTYPAFELVVPAWLCWAALLWWREKDRRGEVVRALSWAAVSAAVVLAPLVVYFALHPDVAAGRVGTLSIFERGWGEGFRLLAGNLWDNIRHFWWRGDHVAKHNVPYMAVFDPLTSLFFALGIVATLIGARRDPRDALPLLWAAWLACASIFSFGAPNLLRTLGMVPAVVLILVSGYELAAKAVERRFSRSAAVVVLAILVTWFSAQEIYRYFVLWRRDPRVALEFNAPYRQMGEAVVRWGDGVDVHIPGDYYHHCTIRYLLWGRRNVYELRIPGSLARGPGAPRDRVLIYSRWTFPQLERGVDLPMVWFPHGRLVWSDSFGLFRGYWIPAGDLMAGDLAAKAVRGLKINPYR